MIVGPSATASAVGYKYGIDFVDWESVQRMAEGKKMKKPILLSGGNPQIAKADGDEPVQEYIAAMPGWKRDVGRKIDELVATTVPDVKKAVRWNSPFYGVEDRGWFLSYHCFTKYIKITFLNGSSLDPPPPVKSKHEEVRYFHIHEDDVIDENQLKRWVEQAADIPGEDLF